MRTPVLVSAMGIGIVIHPSSLSEKWELCCFDKNANWSSCALYDNKKAAQKARTDLFKWHKIVAEEARLRKKKSVKKKA